MTKLLNIDANAKTVKGQKHGYMTAVLYLAPYKASGINVCPFAEKAGCWKTCLNTAGRGGMAKAGATFSANGITLPENAIQRARIWRTQFWANHRAEFLAQLVKEINAFVKKAERKGLTPVVRLNGTSDIQWEKVYMPNPHYTLTGGGVRPMTTIFQLFSKIQFYDYTKIPKRLVTEQPSNYHLTLSYSEASDAYRMRCNNVIIRDGVNTVFVAKDKVTKQLFLDAGCADMDEHDLRFLDPDGTFGVLKAKGSARHEENGFVLKEVPLCLQRTLLT